MTSAVRLAASVLYLATLGVAQLATPSWRMCSTGRDLALAFADGADGALILADMVLTERDWEDLSTPVVIAANRLFTVAGAADESRTGWRRGPTLDMAAETVRGKVRLEPGAGLTFRSLVLLHWREGSSNQAPGVSLVAPVQAAPAGTAATAPPVTIVRLEHVGMLYRYCFPMSIAKPAAEAFRRPNALPGTNTYEWVYPWPANCINSTWARPMERCYTHVGRYLDVASAGADVDSLGRPTPNGYYVQYLDAIALCPRTMPDDCIARLRPVGCSLFLNAQPEEPPPPAPPPMPPYAPPKPQPDADVTNTIVASTDGGGSSGDSDQTGAVIGAAVGGAVGGCLVLALAAIGAVVYRRRRQGSAADGAVDASTAATAGSHREAGGASCPASALNAANSANACIRIDNSSATTAATTNTHDSDISSGTGSKGRLASPAGAGARMLGLGSLASSSGPLEGGGPDDTTVVTRQTPVRKDVKLYIHLNPKPAAAVAAAVASATPHRESPSSAALGSLVNLVVGGPSAPGGGTPSGVDDAASPTTDSDGRRPPGQPGERETEREGGLSSLLALHASSASMVAGNASEVKLTPVMLGKGAFGRVMVGEWNGQRVAVKVVADTHKWGGSQEVLHKCFAQELEILARCQHPNILRLLAACPSPPRLCLVTELMETSLDHVLHGDMAMRLSLRKVLYIAAQIARGLAYLHPTIVHRDVKPGNILVNEAAKPRPVVKISDFGLSRLRSTVLITATPGAGTPNYLAPECFEQGVFGKITHRADIYSLGVVIWEMLTRERPWDGVPPLDIAVGVAREQRRLPLSDLPPSRCPPELKALVEQCWEKDPLRRPAAAELAKILEKMELDMVQPPAPEEGDIRPVGPEPEASPKAVSEAAKKEADAAEDSDGYDYGPILAVSLAGDQRY